jgi:hypothetical protein
LLGGTSDGGRVWDILTIARRHARQGTGWRAIGRGAGGVLAAYAALYEPVIKELTLVDPAPSHRPAAPDAPYGPVLMNVLRVWDIPDALGCLAPRQLHLIGAANPAFDRTVSLYRLAGAAERLER